MWRRRAGAALALAVAWGPGLTATVFAHVVLGTPSLRQSLSGAAVVAEAEWLEAPSPRRVGVADIQDAARIRLRSVWIQREGPALAAGSEIEVLLHAEGLPSLEPGARSLVFLEPTRAHEEVAALAATHPWVSLQGPGQAWRTDGPEGPAVAERARRGLAFLAHRGAGSAGLGEWLLEGLDSPAERVRRDALAELIRLADRPELFDDPGSREAIAARIRGPALSYSQRLALLRVFEERLGEESYALWTVLVGEARDPERREALARIAAASPPEPLRPWLREQAAQGDLAVRRAALAALGREPVAADQPVLLAAAEDADGPAARAAIAGLGRLATPAALERLHRLAGGEDRLRARWARAALRRQERDSKNSKKQSNDIEKEPDPP